MFIHNQKNKIEFKCKDVDYNEGKLIGQILLRTAIVNGNCVGLAHNQIGGNKKVFVARVGKNNTWKVFINPEITFYEGEVTDNLEGCMTFPKKQNSVKRYHKVELRHQVENESVVDYFFGANAHIIQHEADHLKGIHIFNKTKGNI